MIRRTKLGLLGGAGVLGLVPALLAGAPSGGGLPIVGAVPLAQGVFTHTFASPPTVSDCQQATGLACYGPPQLETAYDMKAAYAKGWTGRGETVVIVDAFGSPTIRKDLATFDAAYKLPAPPSFKIIAPVGKIPPFNPSGPAFGWAVETSLDVEYAHSMAPGANILLVETPVAETIGVAGFPQIVAAENYVINHHLGQVISQSFAAPEQTFPSARSLLNLRSAYINAAKHGVSVLGATGDQGPSGPKNPAGTLFFTKRVAQWPATDPLVTAVGGTQLHLNNAGQRVLPDNVWNDTNLLGSLAAGGGGISTIFGRPGYQNGIARIVGNRRGIPDVALSAAVDGGALVQMSFPGIAPGLYIVGGTSEATPLFAGVVAVAAQVAGHSLGLLNPRLYALMGSAALPDITIGNNTVSFRQGGHQYTVPGFVAGTGYDLASGVGTVDGAKLIAALAH